MVLENQAEVFCMFHDGGLIRFIRKQNDVEFIIEIEYLAEVINNYISVKCFSNEASCGGDLVIETQNA